MKIQKKLEEKKKKKKKIILKGKKTLKEYKKNFDYKGVDKIKLEETFNYLENEYNICSIIDEEEFLNKIIEFNCDMKKINKWIEDSL